MAKLSKKMAFEVALDVYMAVMAEDEAEREKYLKYLFAELGIDPEQRAQALEHAKAATRHNARRPAAKPTDNLDGLIEKLETQRKDLLAKLATAPQSENVQSPTTTTPEPAAVEEEPRYKVTAKQRRRLTSFDAMSDSDQLDSLRGMFGEEEQL